MPQLGWAQIYLFALGAFVEGVVGSVVLLEGLQAVTNPRAKHNNNARADICFIRNLTLR